MTIEQTISDYLTKETDLHVGVEKPKDEAEYVVIERVGGPSGHISKAVVAIQSCSKASLLSAIVMDGVVQDAMEHFARLPNISRCECNSTSNRTDPETGVFRYQTVYDITYFK